MEERYIEVGETYGGGTYERHTEEGYTGDIRKRDI